MERSECAPWFLAPPSMEILEQRLRGRGTETEEKVQVRLNNAVGECEFSKTPGFFDKVIVADDEFKTTLPILKVAVFLQHASPKALPKLAQIPNKRIRPHHRTEVSMWKDLEPFFTSPPRSMIKLV